MARTIGLPGKLEINEAVETFNNLAIGQLFVFSGAITLGTKEALYVKVKRDRYVDIGKVEGYNIQDTSYEVKAVNYIASVTNTVDTPVEYKTDNMRIGEFIDPSF